MSRKNQSYSRKYSISLDIEGLQIFPLVTPVSTQNFPVQIYKYAKQRRKRNHSLLDIIEKSGFGVEKRN